MNTLFEIHVHQQVVSGRMVVEDCNVSGGLTGLGVTAGADVSIRRSVPSLYFPVPLLSYWLADWLTGLLTAPLLSYMQLPM